MIYGIIFIGFGILFLTVSFAFNQFDYMISDCTNGWDRLIITGEFSGFFVFTYGIGLLFLFNGYLELKKELKK